MNGDDDIEEAPREEIARLEARLEELADDIERCRKIGLFSKVLVVAGALGLIAELLGIMKLGPPGAVGSITAILGGIVLNGSNGSSMRHIQAALDAAEARRAKLIGGIDMRTAGGRHEPETAALNRWLH